MVQTLWNINWNISISGSSDINQSTFNWKMIYLCIVIPGAMAGVSLNEKFNFKQLNVIAICDVQQLICSSVTNLGVIWLDPHNFLL